MGLFLLSSVSGNAQREASRPIEFSEPRNKGGQSTNDQQFSGGKRRLIDLEERLSKTFNFFDPGDSMGGAPAPQLPRRSRVPAKRSKSAGIFDTEDTRDDSDPLARLRELLESDGSAAQSIDSDMNDRQEPSEPNLLESLKNDNWLVNSITDDAFWGLPLEAEEKRDGATPWQTPQESGMDSFKTAQEVDYRSQMQGFLGRNPANRSSFETIKQGSPSFRENDPYELGQPMRTAMDARRDNYRALLGLEAISSTRESARVITAPPQSSRYGNLGVAPQGMRSGTPQSLQPVGPIGSVSDRTYLQPTAPTAPQKPSVFDPIDINATPGAVSPAASVIANPFYEQPRRQF
jgi:hypothetical protein